MKYLLDTNAVSEWVKPRADPAFAEWIGEVAEDELHLSVITFAELRDGVERLSPGTRRSRLESWLGDELPSRFENRILGIDLDTASAFGRIVATRRKAGRPIGAMDALIAATALRHDLSVVTRDAGGFSGLDFPIVCPWRG